ncbi:MAG TPA: histidine phosphatase family protein [Acidimicrobiia bacterium]|nr:histidine phosphatase family protein [Acidimicrobiia bacterium]
MSAVSEDVPEEGIRQYRFEAPAGATTILLVRHGESQPAHPERPFPTVDGHGDPPLDPVGHEQAERLADRLQHERIDAIYVTTLQRTHQTAAPLAQRIGLEPIVVADLREVFLGDWEGGAFRLRALEGDPVFEAIWREERWDVIPGAEPLDAFDLRLRRGLDHIVAQHPDERVMVVVHGGVIGHVLHQVTGSRRFAFAGTDNASISEIVVHADRTTLRRYNDTSHLG